MIFHADAPAVADKGDELSIQMRLRKAVKTRLVGARFIAIPNGGERTAWGRLNAHREGLQRGFVDGLVMWPNGIAFVEVKARTGSLADDQIDWLNWITECGHAAGMFRSVDSCIAWLIEQGAPAADVAAPFGRMEAA